MNDQVLLSEQLQTALHSRIAIEQAKGILSAQAGTDVTAAFQLMRTSARRSGTPLTAVATAVIDGSLNAEQLQRRGRTGPLTTPSFPAARSWRPWSARRTSPPGCPRS